ncbi:hypothetical protein [Brevundimonas sp. FT23028]|uniref:hypothetical protein n=1 Tax=Brevundimonas sp. FT23028 TaxID=3393748 RepID=UPI003B585D34
MLSTIKPLLCRHDYFWSERHRSERCRRCGKLNDAAEAGADGEAPLQIPFPDTAVQSVRPPEPVMGPPVDDAFLNVPVYVEPLPARRAAASDKVLKAQARQRRAALLDMIERLAAGLEPSREEALDAVLAVIEDAHASEPVLFGEHAAAHFARLHEARTKLVF